MNALVIASATKITVKRLNRAQLMLKILKSVMLEPICQIT